VALLFQHANDHMSADRIILSDVEALPTFARQMGSYQRGGTADSINPSNYDITAFTCVIHHGGSPVGQWLLTFELSRAAKVLFTNR
jgi:hypothetical protein